MRIVVIHGPMRTGKTLHASKFAAHFGCTRTIDWTHAKQHEQPRDGDLLLTNATPTKILRAYPDAVLVPVNDARLAIGLAEVPKGGFPVECEWERRVDARVKVARGPTILLHSGHYFDLLDPAGSRFELEDIAHGLAHTCRYAGQCIRFYSVAEHSWHASYLVPEELKLAALMHDAAEAFIGDVTRPLKQLLPDYRVIEKSIEAVMAERFGLADRCADAAVKRADIAMLAAEQRAMMPAHGSDWAILTSVTPAAVNFRYWSPVEAKAHWLDRFSLLTQHTHVDLEWSPE
jgi:hypothetical protein